jgi:hypothetical protein
MRTRIDKWKCIKLNLVHIEGNNYQNEETSYRMEENSLPAIFQIKD